MLLASLVASQAQTYSVLYSFRGGADGANPWSPLIRNPQGDIFGTTWAGGDSYGVFFKISSDGTETVLHAFDEPDGERPMGQIVRDAVGNFYGTTLQGGASDAGIIYRMDKTGSVTTLFSFHPYVGQDPAGGVTMDSSGNLYGTNQAGGGTSTTGNPYDGDVFELSNSDVYTVLHRFVENTPDGSSPESNLLRDSLGNLYGTTVSGGDYACTKGCGVVFKVSADGVERVIHRFTGQPDDGASPNAGLVRDHAGNFYGTTISGGVANAGTVFKIDNAGNETVLYSFQEEDGMQPRAPLVMDSIGNLYGTTQFGGGTTCPCGTVFKIDTSGVETILHRFTGQGTGDGKQPFAGLILGSDGSLYGTTYRGGSWNAGTVFKITP